MPGGEIVHRARREAYDDIMKGRGPPCTTSDVPADFDVLNTFSYLLDSQGQFYSYAAFGQYPNTSLLAGGPLATGGQKARFSPAVQTTAAEFARDEVAHVSTPKSSFKIIPTYQSCMRMRHQCVSLTEAQSL